MKGFLVLFFAHVLVSSSYGQIDTARIHSTPFKQYVPQDQLDIFNLKQQKISRKGMFALSAWGVGNAIYGSIAAGLSHGEYQVFHASNAIWGGINIFIGIPSLLVSNQRGRVKDYSFGKTILAQHSVEKLFMINGALDFAYIGAGAAMWGFADRSVNPKNRNLLSGGGKSFVMQGGFLLLFDWTMYIVQSQHALKNLNRYTSGLAFTGTGISYNLAF